MKFETGDIISCYTPFIWKKPSTWLAPFIRKATGSKWTHNAIIIECWDSLFVVESFTNGIVMKPISDFPNGMIVRVARPIFNFDKKSIAIKTLSKVTRSKYDISSVFRQLQYQQTGRWKGKTEEDAAKKFYCSEFVAWVFDLKNWYKYAPVDLAESDSFEILYEGYDKEI